MVGLGAALLLLMIVVLWAEWKQKLVHMKWLLWTALCAIPFVYIAGQAGWIVAEVGRQPWVIQGLLPTKAAVSSVSVGAVQTTFFLFVAIFTLFLAIELRIMIKAIKQGPEAEKQ
jgi:cytochrome d ubiquinol oxidase subunit I